MKTIRFLDAAAMLYNYFEPIVVQATLETPECMNIVISAPGADSALSITDIPCRPSMTPAQLFELIQEIERRVRQIDPTLFDRHILNTMRADPV